MPELFEDWKSESSDQSLEDALFGCIGKGFGFLLLLYLAVVLFFCCSCDAQRAITTQGTALKTDGDRLLVLFPDYGGKPDTFAAIWVYEPGVGMIPAEDLEVKIVIQKRKQ